MSNLTTIDEYLAGQPEEIRAVLQKIRQTIHETAPDIEEVLSYQIPNFKYKGALVSFGVAKDHISFYVMSNLAMETLKEDLAGYKVSGTSIHFTVDTPLPASLIKKIVTTRVKENDAKK